MSSSALIPAAATHSALNRRSGVAKNRLLNLAFDDERLIYQVQDDPEEPKSVPADVFKQGCAAIYNRHTACAAHT